MSGRDSAWADRPPWRRSAARDGGRAGNARCARSVGRAGSDLAIRPDCDTVNSMKPLPRRVPALIVHGGAGPDPRIDRVTFRPGMTAAVTAGWRVLVDGGLA